ncbi:aldolase/citrate lyase family protein [Phenylobacterium sp. LjRoot219]|uniref:HpcH/HpaI aldolase family protein n=1 Tax=Phenylobacterium sp. LjRoot219 TaxID=3342283 RepID=UPI003ED03A80
MDKVREAVAAGRPSFGVWVTLPDPISVEVIGRAGYDCAILDTQHGGITWDNLLPAIQALDLSATRAVVRVGGTDQVQIMRALDLGALGVIVPMVSTAAQARVAAEAMRYPPHGIRSFGPVRNYYGVQPVSFEPLCLVMIETAEGLANVEAIAATPGVDGLFVGPVDLALSLGLGPQLQMGPEVLAAIDRVVAACRAHGKISGSASLGLANAGDLAARGVQFIAQGADVGFIRRAAAEELEKLRALRLAE